ncbi:hypothetical protein EHS25_002933 [Saitozyma podzolica]|uniref:Uncharacterized protein n=1 Tax=Saitozyma podzolica TaxID=1890683 RepID=A0A427YCB5_9TREE|nr:hypothetical protein EHS25_002933 [Saitozyma podzolica]
MEPAPLLSIPQALIEAHIILDYPSLAPYHGGIPIPIPPGVQITCHHIKAAVLGGNYPPHIQEAAIDLCAKVDAAQRELVFCDFVTRLDRMNVYTRKDPTVPTAALVAALEPILKPIRDSVDALSKKIDGLSTKVDGVATRVDGLETSAAHSKAVNVNRARSDAGLPLIAVPPPRPRLDNAGQPLQWPDGMPRSYRKLDTAGAVKNLTAERLQQWLAFYDLEQAAEGLSADDNRAFLFASLGGKSQGPLFKAE